MTIVAYSAPKLVLKSISNKGFRSISYRAIHIIVMSFGV